jgi:hypothetical protein
MGEPYLANANRIVTLRPQPIRHRLRRFMSSRERIRRSLGGDDLFAR